MRFGMFIKKPRNSSYQKFDETIIGKYCLETSSFTNSWGTQKSNIILEDKSTMLVPSNNIEFSHNLIDDIEIKKFFIEHPDWMNVYSHYVENNYFPMIGSLEAVSGNWSKPRSLLIKFTNVVEPNWVSFNLLPYTHNNLQYEKNKTYTFMIPAWLYKKIKNK
jgi:hypothetical protein